MFVSLFSSDKEKPYFHEKLLIINEARHDEQLRPKPHRDPYEYCDGYDTPDDDPMFDYGDYYYEFGPRGDEDGNWECDSDY